MRNGLFLVPALLCVAMLLGAAPGSAASLNSPQVQVSPMVATGGYHTVALKVDGTVVAAGLNNSGQCNVGGWTGIRLLPAATTLWDSGPTAQ
jgi:hypothetical protein